MSLMHDPSVPSFHRLRSKSRSIALQVLYHMDILNHITDIQCSNAAWVQHLTQTHFNHFEVPERIRDFSATLIIGTVLHRAAIDQTIMKYTENWKLHRLSAIDRNLLRLATYEMNILQQTHFSIVINEAIELAKQFSTAESASFINAILDKMKLSPEPVDQKLA